MFYCYVDHRDLHLLTPSFPTRRSSEATGAFSCQSGFMDFAYTWHPSRRESDIFTFLASLDFDYFMEKACKCPWRIFDLDRTIAHHRDEIRTERRGRRNFTDQIGKAPCRERVCQYV